MEGIASIRRDIRVRRLASRIRELPRDLRQLIVDHASADVWRENVEEEIMLREMRAILAHGVFGDECSHAIHACLPRMLTSHRTRAWHLLLVHVGTEVVLNQYTGGPRSWCYNNTSHALHNAARTLNSTRLLSRAIYD